MELTPEEQIKKIIKQSKEALLVTDGSEDIDSLASLLAFHLALKKLDKTTTPVAKLGSSSKNLEFLPGFSKIQTNLKGAKDFIISLDISHAKVGQFKYNIKKDKLNIHITPKRGHFEPHDVKIKKGKSKYDLIVVLNTPTLENLNLLYQENAELFYESPLINIDCHSSNENFGEINLVKITASATAEILFSFLKSLDPEIISEDIATCLLTGIISKTNNFQNLKTTPQTFIAAAKLIELGAERELIIQNLYKTRSLSNLHLWGRTLARLKTNLNQKLVWSLLSQADFEKSESTIQDIERIINELKNNTIKADIIFLLAEKKPSLIYLEIKKLNKNIDLQSLKEKLAAYGFKEEKTQDDLILLSTKQGTLTELEQEVLEILEEFIPA